MTGVLVGYGTGILLVGAYECTHLHIGTVVGKSVFDVVSDAGAKAFEQGFFAGPEDGKCLVWCGRLAHLLNFLGVHGVVQQCFLGECEPLHVDAYRVTVKGYGKSILAMADVEMNLWKSWKEGLAMFRAAEQQFILLGTQAFFFHQLVQHLV